MNRTQHIIMLLAFLLATLTACESNDMPIQHADNYDYISFAAQTAKIQTRTDPYENYSSQKHPANMGVFAHYSANTIPTLVEANSIYSNEAITYDSISGNWTTNNRKRWDDYLGKAQQFLFFAYMPKVEGTSLTATTSTSADGLSTTCTYSLSFPFAMTQASTSTGVSTPQAVPAIFDTKEAPIICATSESKEGTDASGKEYTFQRVVNFRFDQTLAGYKLLFLLDKTMGAIRQFRIKSVTLSGELATQGTVSRTYTWSEASRSWAAGAITWSNIQRRNFGVGETSLPEFKIPNKDILLNSTNNTNSTGDTKAEEYVQWGPDFFIIPDKEFKPSIKVNYDVVFKDQNQKEVITRENITSRIILNDQNFNNLKPDQGIRYITPIRILIQPRYLYVLADQDAYTGHLLIE